MNYWVGVLLALVLTSCSQQEKEEEPDYDSMVLLEDDLEEEEEWMTDEYKDRKVIAQDNLEPQELLLIEPLNIDSEPETRLE